MNVRAELTSARTVSPAGGYRPDIDGLRAVAVLAVVLFHLQSDLLRGGFAGVDIFFVISGYLITRLLVHEIESTGNVRFAQFYLRRLRRLFPALACTLLVSFGIAAVLFSPDYFQRASESAIAALFSVSNILFWIESGYFDQTALTKPLLHTWSLSVEEQFYLVWPAILALSARLAGPRSLPITVAAVGIISFSLNAIVANSALFGASPSAFAAITESPHDSLFFLTPFRMFELAIGAAVVWTERRHLPTKRLADALSLLGLALIGCSVVSLTEHDLFPYYHALPPCLGTALLIHAARTGYINGTLSVRPMRFIGKISYSLYLVHWPLIVFYTYRAGHDISFVEGTALFAASIAMATAMYLWIEQPFRSSRISNVPFVTGCAAACGLIAMPAVNAAANDGWPWRVPVEIREALAHAGNQLDERKAFEQSVNAGWYSSFTEDGRQKVLIIGDSMSRDLLIAIAANEQLTSFVQARARSVHHTCQFMIADRTALSEFTANPYSAEQCAKMVSNAINSDQAAEADAIIIWQRWYEWAPDDAIRAALMELDRKTEADIYVVGRKIEFHPTVAELLQHAGLSVKFESLLYSKGSVPSVNAKISEIAKEAGATFIDPTKLQCEDRECFAFSPNGRLLYWDWGHWSLEGASFFASRLSEVPAFRAAFGMID
jgi:Predicted acyltransferases